MQHLLVIRSRLGLSQLCASVGVEISAQGLDQRFSPQSAACLYQVFFVGQPLPPSLHHIEQIVNTLSSRVQALPVEKGALRLADLGYFKLSDLSRIDDAVFI